MHDGGDSGGSDADRPALPAAEDLRAAAGAWLGHMAHELGRADNTLVAYERDLRQLLAWLERDLGRAPALADLARLDARQLRGFLASRRQAKVGSRSLARSLSGLRTFFRWLEMEDVARNRAIRQVARPRVGHGIPKPLSVEKAAAVVDGGMAAELDWIAARDAAVLLLLYGSGLRISEALGIARRDAPTEGREVLRVVGKGGKERLVPVLPVTQAAVARYLALCPYPLAPDGPLFLGAKGGPLEPAHRAARSWSGCAARSAFPTPPRRMRCATRSPRICSPPAPTCGRSRSCWATPACRPRRSTRRWIGSGCWRSTTRRIRGREARLTGPSRSPERSPIPDCPFRAASSATAYCRRGRTGWSRARRPSARSRMA